MSDLPQGWTTATLDNIGKWCSGGTPSRRNKTYFGEGIPWVKSGDLTDGPIFETEEQITKSGLENSSAKILPTGTISMALYGATIGKLGVLTFPAATNQACANVIPNTEVVDPQFLFFYLRSERETLIEKGQGGAQPNISQEIVKAHPIKLAPLNEQRRIVAKLEKLLRRVDAAQAQLTTIPRILKRFRQSILAAACSGNLTADWRAENLNVAVAETLVADLEHRRELMWKQRQQQKLESNNRSGRAKVKYKPPFEASDDVPDFPETWTTVTVSQLALLDVGFAVKSSEFSTEGIRLLRGENIEPGSLRWNDVRFWPEPEVNGHEHLLVESGEIILAMDRPVISTGLKIARVKPSDIPCLLVQRVTRFKMVNPRMTEYLYYNLQLNRFIEDLSAGLTGSDLPHITGEGLAKYTIGLPPLAEQEEVVRRVEALFKTADALEVRYRTAKAHVDKLTQSILAKAFRGELVPQDPNDEPASLLLQRIERAIDTQRRSR